VTGYVLDNSVALAWFFADEATPATAQLFVRAETEGVVVPPMWTFECVSVLVASVAEGVSVSGDVFDFLGVLSEIDIRSVYPDDEVAYRARLAELALATGLSGYDAAYLELAERLGLPLATLDRRLRKAAARRGVTVWPDLP
jgi:predicted nucleic acid-binding protein